MRIHQKISLPASPARIYQVLTTASEFAAFTGAPAEITAEAGGAFSCFSDMITGRQVELVADQRIVQAWRVSDWPVGVYSIVRFSLEAGDDGTTLTLDQAGFPEGAEAHLEPGWHKKYWEPLREYLV